MSSGEVSPVTAKRDAELDKAVITVASISTPRDRADVAAAQAGAAKTSHTPGWLAAIVALGVLVGGAYLSADLFQAGETGQALMVGGAALAGAGLLANPNTRTITMLALVMVGVAVLSSR